MTSQQSRNWQPSLFDQILAMVFMTLSVTLASMTSLWLPSIAPKVADDMGITASLIGYQVLIVYLGAMTTSLMAGGFVSRWGPWRTCQVSLAMFLIAIAMLASGQLALIVLGSFIVGLGYGLANPPAAAILTKIASPKNQALIFSIRFTGVPLGGVIAGQLGPRLALDWGWQSSFVVPLVLVAVTVLLMQPPRARWDRERQPGAVIWRPPLTDVRLAFSYGTVKWLCFSGLFLAAVQLSLISFTVTVLVKEVGYDLIAAGDALSCILVAGVIGRITWGWLADRSRSAFTIMLTTISIIIIGALILTQLSADWPILWVYGVYFVLGFTGMSWNGVFFSEMIRHGPTGRASNIIGAGLFVTFSGVIVGPAAFALLVQLFGDYTATYYLTAALAAAAGITTWLARRHVKPAP
jgi:predicted MFS family arabinose efflux permease